MEFKVSKPFICKNSKKLFSKDSIYSTNDVERGKILQEKGFVEPIIVKQNGNLPVDLEETVDQLKKEITEGFDKDTLELILAAEVNGSNRSTLIAHIESLIKGDDDESGKA